ncbi:MAG: transglycosylase SLT domain-containing protein, partial [Bdellovibrionales bacterium]|nr:transglycosylase SLT domain-containing protein [Bdellovibrionales bacterium]
VKSAPSPVKTPTPAPKVAQPGEDTPMVPELDVSLPATPQIIGGGWTRVKAGYRPIALGRAEVEGLIRSTGRFHQVDPNLSLAVAEAESSFDTNAVSKDGHHSKGLFQLLDSTGREMQGLLGVQEAYDPFDAPQNAFLGIGYLKRLFEMFGKETVLTRDLTTHPARTADDLEKLAVAAFNAGQGAVARAQRKALLAGEDPGSFRAIEKHLPAQTRAYVGRVFEYRLAHQQNDPSQMTA